MRKSAPSFGFSKLNQLHCQQLTQSPQKGLATFQSCIPLNEKKSLTPCHDQIFEQACSTTFTSKILQYSNFQSKGSSNAISLSKSQTQVQNKKKKLNVTTSINKMKTEATECLNLQFSSGIKPLKNRDDHMQKSRKIQSSTNDHNKKWITRVNPEKEFDQKQQILKKLGGKKSSQIKYSLTNEFSPNLKAKMQTEIAENVQQKGYESLMSNKLQLKQNCSILRSEKKISHMKKRNLHLETELCKNQKTKRQIKSQWIVLAQKTEFNSEENMIGLIDTPINKLLQEEQEMFFRKPKFFCDQ